MPPRAKTPKPAKAPPVQLTDAERLRYSQITAAALHAAMAKAAQPLPPPPASASVTSSTPAMPAQGSTVFTPSASAPGSSSTPNAKATKGKAKTTETVIVTPAAPPAAPSNANAKAKGKAKEAVLMPTPAPFTSAPPPASETTVAANRKEKKRRKKAEAALAAANQAQSAPAAGSSNKSAAQPPSPARDLADLVPQAKQIREKEEKEAKVLEEKEQERRAKEEKKARKEAKRLAKLSSAAEVKDADDCATQQAVEMQGMQAAREEEERQKKATDELDAKTFAANRKAEKKLRRKQIAEAKEAEASAEAQRLAAASTSAQRIPFPPPPSSSKEKKKRKRDDSPAVERNAGASAPAAVAPPSTAPEAVQQPAKKKQKKSKATQEHSPVASTSTAILPAAVSSPDKKAKKKKPKHPPRLSQVGGASPLPSPPVASTSAAMPAKPLSVGLDRPRRRRNPNYNPSMALTAAQRASLAAHMPAIRAALNRPEGASDVESSDESSDEMAIDAAGTGIVAPSVAPPSSTLDPLMTLWETIWSWGPPPSLKAPAPTTPVIPARQADLSKLPNGTPAKLLANGGGIPSLIMRLGSPPPPPIQQPGETAQGVISSRPAASTPAKASSVASTSASASASTSKLPPPTTSSAQKRKLAETPAGPPRTRPRVRLGKKEVAELRARSVSASVEGSIVSAPVSEAGAEQSEGFASLPASPKIPAIVGAAPPHSEGQEPEPDDVDELEGATQLYGRPESPEPVQPPAVKEVVQQPPVGGEQNIADDPIEDIEVDKAPGTVEDDPIEEFVEAPLAMEIDELEGATQLYGTGKASSPQEQEDAIAPVVPSPPISPAVSQTASTIYESPARAPVSHLSTPSSMDDEEEVALSLNQHASPTRHPVDLPRHSPSSDSVPVTRDTSPSSPKPDAPLALENVAPAPTPSFPSATPVPSKSTAVSVVAAKQNDSSSSSEDESDDADTSDEEPAQRRKGARKSLSALASEAFKPVKRPRPSLPVPLKAPSAVKRTNTSDLIKAFAPKASASEVSALLDDAEADERSSSSSSASSRAATPVNDPKINGAPTAVVEEPASAVQSLIEPMVEELAPAISLYPPIPRFDDGAAGQPSSINELAPPPSQKLSIISNIPSSSAPVFAVNHLFSPYSTGQTQQPPDESQFAPLGKVSGPLFQDESQGTQAAPTQANANEVGSSQMAMGEFTFTPPAVPEESSDSTHEKSKESEDEQDAPPQESVPLPTPSLSSGGRITRSRVRESRSPSAQPAPPPLSQSRGRVSASQPQSATSNTPRANGSSRAPSASQPLSSKKKAPVSVAVTSRPSLRASSMRSLSQLDERPTPRKTRTASKAATPASSSQPAKKTWIATGEDDSESSDSDGGTQGPSQRKRKLWQ